MGMGKTPRYKSLTKEQKEKVLEQVGLGKDYISICKGLGIPRLALYQQSLEDPEFKQSLEEMRDLSTDDVVDSIRSMADDIHTLADAACARVKLECAKTFAGLRSPRKYGAKLDVNVQHSLDLSSVLMAANGRLVPMLEARRAVAEIAAAAATSPVDSVDSVDSVEDTDSADELSELL